MSSRIEKVKKLFWVKLKFAMTSSVATAIDYLLFLFLFYALSFEPVPANIIAASCGMVANFFLQKRYVFDLQRKVSTAFLMSAVVSVGGIALSTLIIYLLNKIEFFANYQFLAKAIATGTVFFYNFYFKRYVFEKRFFSVD
jgi:putative flippase GtrA